MRVMVLVKATAGQSEAGVMPSEEMLTAMGKLQRGAGQGGSAPRRRRAAPQLAGCAGALLRHDRTVIDGPFAETKELVAGYWLWQVSSMEEAIEWVKRMPNPSGEESEVEIRPVFEPDDFGEAFTPELREREERLRSQATQR